MTPALLAWVSPFIAPQTQHPLIVFADGLYIFGSLFVLLHELGHAFSGLLSGHHIEQIRLGYGALIASHRFFDTEWHLRLLPFGGLCYGFPKKPRISRFARAAFIAGGPTVNLVSLIVGVAFLSNQVSEPPSIIHTLQLPWIFVIGNGWLFFTSLVPMQLNSDGQKIPNDGLQLVQLWIAPNSLEVHASIPPLRPGHGQSLKIAALLLQCLGFGVGIVGIIFLQLIWQESFSSGLFFLAQP